ncbi:reverse transcriptase domain-containing protein [Tanacetum coccineum]
MPKYAKFLKGLLTNKARLEEACKITMTEKCSEVLLNKLPSKEKDPGSFTIPCDIDQLHIDNALTDLGASISLMPYTMYKKLVDKFVFLATARAMIDVFNKKITLRVGDDEVIFDVDQSIKRSTTEDDECYGIDDLDDTINEEAQELLANEEPGSFLTRGLEKSIDQSDLECFEYASSNENNGSDSENSIWRIDSANTLYLVMRGTTKSNDIKSGHLYSSSANEINEKKPELKNLPQHLEYAYLHGDKSFPIIISSELSEKEKIALLQILMKDDYKPVIQPQRRLNPKVQDVVKNKIVKLLDSGLIYPISDNSWFLDRGNEYYCFLDGFSGFFQIPITSKDQENTTFTCPYGTFTYRRMPFGLCNAPATFQRCMTAIFHDMVEDFMEVFMDDFSVFEGIVLGHKISGAGIEVDRAKINVIAKLPYPTNVNGVRSFLGQRVDGKFEPIYYASKTLNNAQEHYTTTEKELLADVFSFDKFRQYLILSKTVVYTDHSAMKYLFSKEDAKPRLIRWVLLL